MSRRFFSRSPNKNEADPLNENDSITSRSLFFSPITQAPIISDMGSLNWDDMQCQGSLGPAVSDPMWTAIRNGGAICDLIKASPEEVITVLRDHAVKKLGSFTVPDVDVLVAFGNYSMLTRGSDTARDGNFEANWREIINNAVRNNKRAKIYYRSGGWEENVTLAAYVVNIKNAAAGREEGLLSPLVHKSQSGATSNELWDFPAVRAVIEYKWCHWARFYLMIEFGLYLGWLICFTTFVVTYIYEDNPGQQFDDVDGSGIYMRIQASLFDVLTIVFMLPFLRIEYNTIRFYKLRWFQMWNLLDVAAYILQIIITYGHVTTTFIDNNPYNTLLAIQSVLLYIKIQYFARVFAEGTSFAELLARVMYRVRWFFVFIILSTVSAALAFSVLYKRDAARNESKETDEDFGDFARSIVTTYAVLLGDFDSGYVFDTTNRVAKGIFILGFQVLMSITVLNLLIAVMTESYGSIMTDQRIMFNMGRAQVMDELEIALPVGWGPKLKPYCHFIVVEKRKDNVPELSAELSAPSTLTVGQSELQRQVFDLTTTVQELKSTMDTLVKKLDTDKQLDLE